jgi:hypothetical protein
MQTDLDQQFTVDLSIEDFGIPTYGSITYYASVARTTPQQLVTEVLRRCRTDAAEYYMGKRFPNATNVESFVLTTTQKSDTEISCDLATGRLYVTVARIKLTKDGDLQRYLTLPGGETIVLPPPLGRCGNVQQICLFQDDEVSLDDSEVLDAPLVTTPVDSDM